MTGPATTGLLRVVGSKRDRCGASWTGGTPVPPFVARRGARNQVHRLMSGKRRWDRRPACPQSAPNSTSQARDPQMAAGDLVLAFTGASGVPYGVRLLEVLLRAGRTVHLCISPAAAEVILHEVGRSVRLDDFDPADLLGKSAGEL